MSSKGRYSTQNLPVIEATGMTEGYAELQKDVPQYQCILLLRSIITMQLTCQELGE